MSEAPARGLQEAADERPARWRRRHETEDEHKGTCRSERDLGGVHRLPAARAAFA